MRFTLLALTVLEHLEAGERSSTSEELMRELGLVVVVLVGLLVVVAGLVESEHLGGVVRVLLVWYELGWFDDCK